MQFMQFRVWPKHKEQTMIGSSTRLGQEMASQVFGKQLTLLDVSAVSKYGCDLHNPLRPFSHLSLDWLLGLIASVQPTEEYGDDFRMYL